MAISARKKAIRKRKSLKKAVPYTAKGVEASKLRRRKHQLVRRFGIPESLLGGSLNQVTRKCGKPTCHCVSGEGHPMWTLTYSVDGKRHVEFIPNELAPILEPLADEARAYRDALREVLAINAQLVTHWRQQQRLASKNSRPKK